MYDKSDLIKETYITALNKKVSIYGSISYFNKKTKNEMFKIISPENFLKFFVNRDTNKDSLSFQLTSISGNLPTLKDKKIHNLSLTRIGRKRKLSMQELIETIIIHTQQNFEIIDGLNPVQIEIKDDRIINVLKKHKNVIYELTLLRILLQQSTKNNTEQVFITCGELNDVKKALIDSKIYGLLGIIDLKKITSWDEINGQLIWINATFEEQKEINNSRHLCFPFTTKTLNDLLSFSIYLLDDNNKEITFVDGGKKLVF